MKITYKITKKRGNWRPVVSYTCARTQEEVDLGVPSVEVTTRIPSVKYCTTGFVGPREKEREEGWEPHDFISIDAGYSGKTTHESYFSLPWRPGKNPQYPEVEEAFRMLQAAYDAALKETAESGSLDVEKELDHTAETKRILAPIIAKRRILDSL